MRHAIGGYEIDDDPGRIDADAAAAFLTARAYWGRQREAAEIRRQIASAWRVVGGYDRAGAMVGFARAFGDGQTAYLADVYVLPAHRGAGLGTAIVAMMIDEGPGAAQRWMLHTADAHGLYRQFGFAAAPAAYLERPRPGAGPGEARGGPGGSRHGLGSPLALQGTAVRLEPLRHEHVPGLVAAAAGGGDLYRWTAVPQDQARARRYVEAAAAARDAGTAVPFAVVSAADGRVIGSTRFWNLDWWPWPEPKGTPDACEIGHSWLSPGAVGTGANTEMKRLMLAHAFEVWRVHSVCLHTDARNQRSRRAMEKIGARSEGILRAHRLGADGKPRDSARYGITAAEWPRVRRHLDALLRRSRARRT
ncbi:MAG TPA: GNAT family N-acetyltransferase [Streptosporangiaceae bacterium]|nr:GNAT family N-acetyltransferase [Streptosporangiaceae bacterium]